MSKRMLRDHKIFFNSCVVLVQSKLFEENIKLSNEEFEKLLKSEELQREAIFKLNQKDLTERLFEEFRGSEPYMLCEQKAEDLMKSIPNELMPNLEEWLDNKPLSNIKLHCKSVNDIINMYGENYKISVFEALKCFTAWKETEYADSNFCEYYFAEL